MMTYRDPTFDIDHMQSTMRHHCLDDVWRNSDTKIAGRGMAMAAASTCSQLGKQGHYARNCQKGRATMIANPLDPTTRRATILPRARQDPRTADQIWCSVHKTTSHSDED